MTAASETLLPALTDEHRMLRDTVRDFAQREIVPVAAQLDETGEFPQETVRRMGALGLMGIEVPEEYGGAGMDALACALTIRELARVDASHSVIVSVNNSLYCGALLAFGSDAQKREFLIPVASGRQTGAIQPERALLRQRRRHDGLPRAAQRGRHTLAHQRP